MNVSSNFMSTVHNRFIITDRILAIGKILANLLALHGLDHLLRNRFLDRLDIEKLVKELVEADDLLIRQCFTTEAFVIDRLKNIDQGFKGCVSLWDGLEYLCL